MTLPDFVQVMLLGSSGPLADSALNVAISCLGVAVVMAGVFVARWGCVQVLGLIEDGYADQVIRSNRIKAARQRAYIAFGERFDRANGRDLDWWRRRDGSDEDEPARDRRSGALLDDPDAGNFRRKRGWHGIEDDDLPY